MTSAKSFSARIDHQRRKNIKKAQAEAQAGPARAEPDATPIGDAIQAFRQRGDIAFGIPAHDRVPAGCHRSRPAGWVPRRFAPTSQ
ncbi:hypothetical protein A4G26_24935 [Mycobacterium kansasii]|uniref:Uncharacterized protein n=1 Tax=Mycobacterium innocens TaxID=2341083 RepID=A0A498PX43_9MYCO|nr:MULTISPECIES: hypothetical protein [Mycobacterium]KZS71477.1 hypothetical protein A4G26_24935 [Mycobacterium kansasii]VBA37507.1 hypothetical protein LAUMK13_01670 [Mycobacterium innocens]